MHSRSITLVLALAFASAVVGCGTDGPERRTLRVFAASSLTEAFGELERRFEDLHPDVRVSVVFAGSQVLRLQIEQDAPADVFASANPSHMQALVDAGLVVQAETFAHNRLVVIVPLHNPAGVASFEDLPRAERLVIGTPEVPIGRYTREALRRSAERLGPAFEQEVRRRVVSEETNVRLVRAKVELGEADAAVVFATDALASDRVKAVPLPEELDIQADYPLGVVARTRQPELARAWVEFVLGPEGRATLGRHGFVVDR